MTRSISLAVVALLLASSASAAPPGNETCRTISDPGERLACYDRVAGREIPAAGDQPHRRSSDTAVPSSPPVASSPTRAAEPARDRSNAVTNGRIVAVHQLRHGYFSLELDNGASYETTVVGTPPPVGAEVHIRHTLLGTTFFDIRGWSPITVRQSRQR